jgi:hypothetical protein
MKKFFTIASFLLIGMLNLNAQYFWQVAQVDSIKGERIYELNETPENIVLYFHQCSGGIMQPHNTTVYNLTWYKNTEDSNTGGEVVQGWGGTYNTTVNFHPQTSRTPPTNEAGEFYYYAVFSNPSMTTCGFTGELRSPTVKITVQNCSEESVDVVESCTPFTWIDGVTYSESNNTATYVIEEGAAGGCDSIVSLDLVVYETSTPEINITGPTISTTYQEVTYQWLDCDNGNVEIEGATAQSFTPSESGNYAVEITDNGCKTISDCAFVESTVTQNCLNLDGVDDYVDYGNYAATNFGGSDFTIEFQIMYPDSTGYTPVVAKRDICEASNFWNVAIDYDGHLFLEINGYDFLLKSTNDVISKKWMHVSIVRSANSYQMYIDGELDVEVTVDSPTMYYIQNSASLMLGKSACVDAPYTAPPFQGKLDELRIWNKARSVEEIQANMYCDLTGFEGGLVLYNNFNQGVANGDNTFISSVEDKSIGNAIGAMMNFSNIGDESNFVDKEQLCVISSLEDEVEYQQSISLFPNPSADFINVRGLKGTQDYVILNLLGKEISNGSLNSGGEINLANIPSGVYLIQFDKQAAMKFIKE